MDEFDWGYDGFEKSDAIAQVHSVCPHAELIGTGYGLLVFYLDKTMPYVLRDVVTMDAMQYKSSDVVYDPNCPSEHMYFLNTNHIFLRYLGDSLFNVQSQRVPFNQDAVNVPVIMYANMTMDNARTSGVMHA